MARNADQILTEWLVLHAQGGSAAAMDQLLKIWYPKLLRYSTHQLRSQEMAKDVVQDSLLAVARRIGKLRDPVAFPKWAYQILHRRGVDCLRKEIRHRRAAELEGDPTVIRSTDVDLATTLGQRLEIGKAMESLNEHSYQIVQLRYLDGLSLKEIGAVIDIPEGTVKSRLHQARTKLKKLLVEENNG